MITSPLFRSILLAIFALGSLSHAAPRTARWKPVEEAIENDQPATAAKALAGIERKAVADKDWGDACRAIAWRVRLEAGKDTKEDIDEEAAAIRALDARVATVPAEVQPILRSLSAAWLHSYYSDHEGDFAERSATATAPGDDFTTWDLPRILAEIDKRFQDALADRALLQRTSVSILDGITDKGAIGDKACPTLFDFLARFAIGFYAREETAASHPQDDFTLSPSSPALGSVEEFLAWQPQAADATSPKLRALRLHQDLLNFHRDDKDRTAFLHCDLERIRWAGQAADGEKKDARLEAAQRAFIDKNASHPWSALARLDVADRLRKDGKHKEARAMALQGEQDFPGHPFGKTCRNFVNDIEARRLSIEHRTTWTPAGARLVASHSNIDHVWIRLYKLKWKPSQVLNEDSSIVPDEEHLPGFLKKKPDFAWDAALPDDKDFRPRQTSLPVPDGLKPALYFVVASAREDFALGDNHVSTGLASVTNLCLTVRDHPGGGLEGFVTEARSGAPVPGAEVGMWFEKEGFSLLPGPSHKDTKTNDDGFFVLPDNKPRNSRLVMAEKDGQQVMLESSKDGEKVEAAKPSEKIVFFTDRAIYRPGQTIHFKGIVGYSDPAKGAYHAVAKKAVTVVLRDSNEKEIAKQDLVTNERGSLAGTFTAPGGSVLGRFEIVAGDLGQCSISVEEYKRPKFTVKIDPPAAPAALGAKVEVKVHAESYTGASIDAAKVTWRVTRAARVSEWWFCLGGARFPNSESKEIAHGTATTAADGTFLISFTAEPDPAVPEDSDPVYSFNVSADVTDSAGETRSDSFSAQVAYTTLSASVETADWNDGTKSVAIKVRTTTHDGEPRAASGLLKIHRLKEPETCLPEHLAPLTDDRSGKSWDYTYDPEKWPLGPVLKAVEVKTDEKEGEGVARLTLPAGLFRAVFETKDTNGRKVVGVASLQVVKAGDERLPSKIPFFVTVPEEEVQPGQAARVFWGSGYPEARACIEWVVDDRVVKREWSAPGRTQQMFSFPVEEALRGGVGFVVFQTTMNEMREESGTLDVPWSNKDLKLQWEHLTSKLAPGAKDTWTLAIHGPDGEPVKAAAELVATLYDASLDAYDTHGFPGFSGWFRSQSYPSQDVDFADEDSSFDGVADWKTPEPFSVVGPLLREFRDEVVQDGGGESGKAVMAYSPAASGGSSRRFARQVVTAGNRSGDFAITRNAIDGIVRSEAGIASGAFPMSPATPADPFAASAGYVEKPQARPGLAQVAARQNLQETAFFYPQLTTDGDGTVRMTFTMPEALTKWRFLGFAHDAALRSGRLEGETVTAKDLMVQPNPPRFLREGDAIEFTVKVTNQADKEQSGTVRLTLADSATQKDATASLGVTAPEQDFKVPAKESRTFSWRLAVPDGAGFLTYKAVASSGDLSDGEEGWLPVIPRRILVTESMALPIRGAGEKKFDFRKLRESGQSDTLESKFVHVQAVSQPGWYAVMALPYLMEFPHECAEQTFNRYYANALAKQIALSDPKIRRIFDLWKGTPALDSPLKKNSDLNGILIEETPWLRQADNESQARRNVGLLFDENKMGNELDRALDKLRAMQRGDGLWPWFPGGPGCEYISLYIATGFGRMRALGVETDITPALKALPALDHDLTERYDEILKEEKKHPGTMKENHLDQWVAHHLYTRTFFLKDKAVGRGDKDAFDYFAGQAKKYWVSLGMRMARAHAGLALMRLGEKDTALLVTRSLKENALVDEEQGMRWRDAEGDGEGWWWWRAPIETQALMVEAFREIDADAQLVEDCQVWLIKQKQVADWKTSKATADAVYALLLGDPPAGAKPKLSKFLSSDALIEVSLGGTVVKPEKVEAGTGFYESRFAGAAVKPEFGNIVVTKKDAGVSWASVHWQYLEDMAKVTEHNAGPLKLEKKLFIRKNTDKGPVLEEVKGPVSVGDELVTRVILRNDRAMEFVHLKDQRGSGTEPVNVLSGYRWQDGFGYYEVTRDTAGHFFIDRLPIGTHVFETSVRVQHAGKYQTGLAEIRCMYAPEFNAHSGSVGVEAGK